MAHSLASLGLSQLKQFISQDFLTTPSKTELFPASRFFLALPGLPGALYSAVFLFIVCHRSLNCELPKGKGSVILDAAVSSVSRAGPATSKMLNKYLLDGNRMVTEVVILEGDRSLCQRQGWDLELRSRGLGQVHKVPSPPPVPASSACVTYSPSAFSLSLGIWAQPCNSLWTLADKTQQRTVHSIHSCPLFHYENMPGQAWVRGDLWIRGGEHCAPREQPVQRPKGRNSPGVLQRQQKVSLAAAQ